MQRPVPVPQTITAAETNHIGSISLHEGSRAVDRSIIHMSTYSTYDTDTRGGGIEQHRQPPSFFLIVTHHHHFFFFLQFDYLYFEYYTSYLPPSYSNCTVRGGAPRKINCTVRGGGFDGRLDALWRPRGVPPSTAVVLPPRVVVAATHSKVF